MLWVIPTMKMGLTMGMVSDFFFCGCLWAFLGILGYSWVFLGILGYSWVLLGTLEHLVSSAGLELEEHD
jgi:hypothetical protein